VARLGLQRHSSLPRDHATYHRAVAVLLRDVERGEQPVTDRDEIGEKALAFALAGDTFQIAVFGINGPISLAPPNTVWFREAKMEFIR
jgi:hypothetical protein